MQSENNQWIKWGFVSLSFLLIFISLFIPASPIMGGKGWVTLAILCFAIILWFTEVIPAAITSLSVIVLFPLFNVLTFEEAALGLGNEIIWLIIAMLIMGEAVKKTNLDKRLAFFIVSLAQGKINLIFLSFIILAFLLTFIIPSAMGRLTILLPIALGFIQAFENNVDRNFSKSIILIITFTPYISTVSVLTGAGGSIYAVSLFETMLGFEWGYLQWLIVMMPITLIVLLLFWLLLLWLFPTNVSYLENVNTFLDNKKREIGKITVSEKKLIGLYLLLILLWMTKGIHQMSISMSALLITIFIFVPGFNIISWKNVRKDIDWEVPLLFASGFTIALGLEKNGVVNGMKVLLEDYLNSFTGFLLPLILMLIFVFIRLFFTNFTAMVASLMPVALSFASGSPFNPVWLGMICVIASSTSYVLPSQSIGNMTTFATNYYSSRDLLVLGSYVTLLMIVITLIVAFVYWPLVGIPIYES